MATKNNPGKFDCYANAEPDEPMFVLLGRDRHAGLLVRVWALIRHAEGEDEEKIDEALECATAMDVYARRLGKDPTGIETAYQRVLLSVTDGMAEHPDGYEHTCSCLLCLSYGEPLDQ